MKFKSMKQTVKELWSLWKKDVRWDEQSTKKKATSVWFGVSLFVLGICGSSVLFTILAVINFVAATYFTAKYVPEPKD